MSNAASIKDGRAYVEAFLDTSPFFRGLKSMNAGMRAWGARLTSYGALATGIGGGRSSLPWPVPSRCSRTWGETWKISPHERE